MNRKEKKLRKFIRQEAKKIFSEGDIITKEELPRDIKRAFDEFNDTDIERIKVEDDEIAIYIHSYVPLDYDTVKRMSRIKRDVEIMSTNRGTLLIVFY